MPTPPTKPTPPTPPTMNTTSGGATSTDTHTPAINNSQVTTQPKPTTTASTDESTKTPAPSVSVPPLGVSSSNTNTTATKETSSETAIPPTPTIPVSQNKPSSIAFSLIIAVLVLTIGAVVIMSLWKNKKQQGAVIDYTAESSDEIVDLILSTKTVDSLPTIPQAKPKKSTTPPPKPLPKKIAPKTDSKPTEKGGFEVRI